MKNIIKYLSDFFMVFLAISLGFLADNFRENYSIKRDLSQNFNSLINDLKQDSINMHNIMLLKKSKEFEDLGKLNNVVYLYHKGEISWGQMKDEIKTLKGIPPYSTLFMDNSTFKNMQSSGLLSYIEDESIKNRLSYYYEVILKRLSDNNASFDKVGMQFSNKDFPFVTLNINGEYLKEGFTKKADDYLEIQLNLNSSKKILTSEKFMFDLDSYTGEFMFYNGLMKTIMSYNQNLLKSLYNIQNQSL